MKRRELMLLLGAAMAMPGRLHAQQKARPLIGYLHPGLLDALSATSLAAFRQGLSDAGYVEGQNLVIEYRWAEGHYDRLPGLAAELVGRNVDLIAAVGQAAPPAKNATSTIPIVFLGIGDPVGMGLVSSLARPGGNITGFSNVFGDLTIKRLELLSELVPKASVIAWLVNSNQPPSENQIQVMQDAARARGVQLAILKAGSEGDVDLAFAALAELRVGALLVAGDAFFVGRREQFVMLALRHAVPAIYAWRAVPVAGGLISYGINNVAVWRQAGIYAGRILKGEKPADMPVQQPTKFELVINLNTAKALGLTVPQSLLARADEVIE